MHACGITPSAEQLNKIREDAMKKMQEAQKVLDEASRLW